MIIISSWTNDKIKNKIECIMIIDNDNNNNNNKRCIYIQDKQNIKNEFFNHRMSHISVSFF